MNSMRALTALLVALLISAPAWAQQRQAPAAPKSDPRATLRALEDAFAAVADRATPAVVHVSTVPKKSPAGAPEDVPERFKEFFGDEFYDRYFRRRPREDARATGSGVVVDPKGYILTNNHVIENAQEIIVRLSDQRKFTARLVGRDPKTDLAVLKVDAPGPLPVAELGDSSQLRVGQWAIAIGNPFGLDRTVTVGIVSATARTRVGVTQYDNFIQTDASINPGNSGGPLLNIDGKVIGINTAIVAAGQGIGFAIPINQARDVMQQLITRGRVVRGWLGIVIQDLTDQLAGSFGVKEGGGVLVAEVMKGSPADTAGLKAGDIVVELGGSAIKEVPDLQRRVASVKPGQTMKLTVIRERKPMSFSVKMGEMPSDEPVVAEGPATDEWGLSVESLTGDAALRLDLPVHRGLLVTDVQPGSPAEKAGLRRGDVILEFARRPADDPANLSKALGALKPGESLLIYVHRAGGSGGGANQYLVMERSRKP
jgi:Do/DeqQ family serine protease